MTFKTLEDVENFYYNYAGNLGFSVRKSTTAADHSQGFTRRTLVCSKQGSSNVVILPTNTSLKKPRKIQNPRSECEARITFAIKENIWIVTACITSHNHVLTTPSKRRFLTSKLAIEK